MNTLQVSILSQTWSGLCCPMEGIAQLSPVLKVVQCPWD